jgi:hypothetical protein
MPKLALELIPGPTLCSTFPTGEKFEQYDVHRTAISLYLQIANVGSAPTSVANVSIAYHWHLSRFNLIWIRYRLFWFWLHQPIVTMEDFQTKIGDQIKVYPS